MALKKLADSINGTISRFSLVPTLHGEYQELKFSLLLFSGSKNSPPYLRILVIKPSPFRLSVYKESRLSHFGKKLGLVREVKSGDEIFDNEFLIFSNKSAQGINYLNSNDVKNAIRAIFNKGFNALLIDSKRISIQKTRYNLEIDLEPSNVMDILQELRLLADGVIGSMGE